MRRAIYALLFLCLGLQCILGYKVWQRFQVEALNVKPPQLNFRAARQIFPFSVIPGGVLDERELADSMAKDEVVRKHYSGLQPDRMWFSRTKQPMVAYVSYRKGSNVCWTSHPVTIPQMSWCSRTKIWFVPVAEIVSKSRSPSLCRPWWCPPTFPLRISHWTQDFH